MNYLMVNDADWPTFDARITALKEEGYVFSPAYVEQVQKEDGTPYPGGFGCLKFDETVPPEQLFMLPDVEFRYSSETNEWVPSGPTEADQTILAGLYTYFHELLGAV